jgi:hypothetical protein
MAIVIKEKEFWANHNARNSARFEWDKWADGQTWRLEHGVDFTSTIKSFRALMYRTYKAKGLKVRSVVDNTENTITFQVLPVTEQ